MRTVFAAIARAFAAVTTRLSTVWSFCRDTGKWVATTVATTVGSIGGGGSAPAASSPLQELEAAMAAEAARPVDELVKKAAEVCVPPAQGGDGIDRLQRACRDINTSGQPAREDCMALSELQRDWLQELSPSMRLVVGNVDREALVAHLKGGKGLKGVIRCDQQSIDGWRHAAAIRQTIRDTCVEMGFDEPDLDAQAPRIAI